MKLSFFIDNCAEASPAKLAKSAFALFNLLTVGVLLTLLSRDLFVAIIMAIAIGHAFMQTGESLVMIGCRHNVLTAWQNFSQLDLIVLADNARYRAQEEWLKRGRFIDRLGLPYEHVSTARITDDITAVFASKGSSMTCTLIMRGVDVNSVGQLAFIHGALCMWLEWQVVFLDFKDAKIMR